MGKNYERRPFRFEITYHLIGLILLKSPRLEILTWGFLIKSYSPFSKRIIIFTS